MILTTIAFVAQASPTATATPDAVAIAATAKAWFISLAHGKILDKSQLTDQMVALLTPDILTKLSAAQAYGDPTNLELKKSGPDGASMGYLYDLTCPNGHALMIIEFDASGKISGLRMMPAPKQ